MMVFSPAKSYEFIVFGAIFVPAIRFAGTEGRSPIVPDYDQIVGFGSHARTVSIQLLHASKPPALPPVAKVLQDVSTAHCRVREHFRVVLIFDATFCKTCSGSPGQPPVARPYCLFPAYDQWVGIISHAQSPVAHLTC